MQSASLRRLDVGGFAACALATTYDDLGIQGERLRKAIRGRKSLYMAMVEKRRAMDSKSKSSSRNSADDVSRQASEDVFIQS